MIYILTGIIILVVALKYKRRIMNTMRILGFCYLGLALLNAITSGFPGHNILLYLAGTNEAGSIILLLIGVGFLVYGTSEIRMPVDHIAEDDLANGDDILMH